MTPPAQSKRRAWAVALLMLLAAVALQARWPIPPRVLGIAVGSGVIGGLLPQAPGWNGLRVFVHIVPICFAVAVWLGHAAIGLQFLALGQCFLLVIGASRSVELLRRKGGGA